VSEPLWTAARTLGRRVRRFFDTPPDMDAAPLELLQAALDDLEKKIVPAGRGTRVFPYNRIDVTVAQPAVDTAAIEAVFAQLETRLRERLAELRCEAPGPLDVGVSVSSGDGHAAPVLRVECSSDRAVFSSRPSAARRAPELRLRIEKGVCEKPEYTFSGDAVSIGRGAEPADALGRVRRNDIAFSDTRDGVSETVARAHARIEFDRQAGAYLLFNESGTNPTFLVRGGRSLRVAPRDRRGVRLTSGDALQLGRALVTISIADL
jgi:hypothetical protein